MKSLLVIFCISALFTSCANEEIYPQYECVEGVVIGKIRSAGGGLAVKLAEPLEGAVIWQSNDNVVEVLNIPVEFTFAGTTIFFEMRKAKEGERGPISTDGDESIPLVLYGSNFSNTGCQEPGQ